MDKRTVVALLLIGLIIILYPYYVQLITGGKGVTPPKKVEQTPVDTSTHQEKKEEVPLKPSGWISFAPSTIPEKKVFVENSFYKGVFSTKGGVLTSFIFKKYKYSQGGLIEIIPEDTIYPLNISFPDMNLDLSKVDFSVDKENLFLSKSHPVDSLTFSFSDEEGLSIAKRFIFFEDKYDFQLQFEVSSKDKNLGRSYLLAWGSGVSPTETNLPEDLGYFEASSMMGTEVVKIKNFQQPKGSDIGKMEEFRSGETKWVATRSKYFFASLVPLSNPAIGFKAEGTREVKSLNDKKLEEKKIGITLEMPTGGKTFQNNFMVYVGPIDYHILKNYKIGLENLVDLGWKIIKPFSLAVLWIFVNLHKVIPNYGLVIIVFTILIKILFHPLTHKSVTLAQKMQELQPKITALKEKYKKDPQRMNQEIMKLYKEQGANPLGGCLPLLPQMPLFYGLFVVFRSTIELRGANFIFWLNDLSQMDKYYILPVIMAVTMFWQQKMTIKDPKQMAMVYLMPVLFFFLFKSFPAGLTLYWTFYNILSLIEQYYIKSKTKPKETVA
ncbi:MAG: membrane protein insertase YidC [candidate division Zixibacteria bacterium]|nr:membrane protein insertase YidC [candidate division Zixibacteria bacterium]